MARLQFITRMGMSSLAITKKTKKTGVAFTDGLTVPRRLAHTKMVFDQVGTGGLRGKKLGMCSTGKELSSEFKSMHWRLARLGCRAKHGKKYRQLQNIPLHLKIRGHVEALVNLRRSVIKLTPLSWPKKWLGKESRHRRLPSKRRENLQNQRRRQKTMSIFEIRVFAVQWAESA